MKLHACKSALLTVVLASLLPVTPLVAAAPPEQDTLDLRQQISDLKKEIELLRQQSRADRQLLDDTIRTVDRMTRTLESIQDRIDRVASRETRRSAFLNPDATLRLDNRLPVRASIIIDGVTYSVPAFGSIDLSNRPAGTLRYRVTADGFGMSEQRSIQLNAGQTHTLRIDY